MFFKLVDALRCETGCIFYNITSKYSKEANTNLTDLHGNNL